MVDEKTPLLHDSVGSQNASATPHKSKDSWPRKLSSTVVGTLRVFISTVLAPGYYVVACFYDDKGHFSMTMPFIRIGRKFSTKSRRRRKQAMPATALDMLEKERRHSKETSAISEPQHDVEKHHKKKQQPHHQRTASASSASSASSQDADTNEVPKPKRSIRIKAINEDALRKRRDRKGNGADQRLKPQSGAPPAELTVDPIKSPTSSASHLTRYPRAPAPPRPLIPKRQPSYTLPTSPTFNPGKKTLIIDLDETLIHSMAKGGRMSTGHMVEVKLQNPVGASGAMMGPPVPILYYVHKRPHCDEFLKKVSKWYNLIVFTASVQEYADPVIDWLELERKYFSKRYYRQDCTFRNGAFIKDLSHVEADLSKVMILDNSPLSYIFHEDNAIPIEGWISDPTDNDLLHLIPLLEGLQYTTDVRALLSLRLGEATGPS